MKGRRCRALPASHLIVFVEHFIDPMDHRIRQILVVLGIIPGNIHKQTVEKNKDNTLVIRGIVFGTVHSSDLASNDDRGILEE